ncbi:MAG: flavodoxin family protein [bacterium]|nr:flavodoxin family protein [bacterium]
MKVLTILGSPRKNSNTAKVLECMAEELAEQGHDVENIAVVDFVINGCMSCFACKNNPDEPDCIQDDEAKFIFEKMIDADAVIISTPLYCWGFSSQIKALIDRSICLVTGFGGPNHKSLVGGKRFALVATSGGPLENNLDLLEKPFDMEMFFLATVNAGHFLVPNCYNAEVDENITPEIIEMAKIFARELVKQ